MQPRAHITRTAVLAVRIPFLGLVLTSTGTAAATSAPPTQAAPTSTRSSAISPTPREGDAAQLHKNYLERAARGNIDLVFLGDSITQGWADNPIWKRHFSPRNAANFGISGDRTQHVLWRIDHGTLDGIEPKAVVLMIGTNNLDANSPDEIAEGVTAIVDRIQRKLPKTQILLLGIFPRGATRSPDLVSDQADPRIADVNKRIAQLGDDPLVTYLDIGSQFLDHEGKVPRELMPDFLHLSRKGYTVWADSIEPALWEIMEKQKK